LSSLLGLDLSIQPEQNQESWYDAIALGGQASPSITAMKLNP